MTNSVRVLGGHIKSAARDVVHAYRQMGMVFFAILLFAGLLWVSESPKRYVPVLTAELLVLAGVAYYHGGVLPI